MKKLFRFSKQPFGQVLLATLVFCFIFSALFIGLFRAGQAYTQKEIARRSTDLTALSAGAVYANGLQMVRYSNALLMLSVAVDFATMGLSVLPFVEGFPVTVPAAIAAAKKADPHFRERIQKIQSQFFGIPFPSDRKNALKNKLGIYPSWIEIKGHQAAKSNGFINDALNIQLFYNLSTPRDLPECRIPDMALRFRTAGELLPQDDSPYYSLNSGGITHYFSRGQVESAQNPKFPSQMRVRLDLPSPFAGKFVKSESGQGTSGENPLSKYSGIGPSSWKFLKDLLKDIVLDVTHRDTPPYHALSVGSRMINSYGPKPNSFLETSGVLIDGGGLAAWNLTEPLFKTQLQKARISPVTRLIQHSLFEPFS